MYNEYQGHRKSNQANISTVKPKYEWMNDEDWRLPEKARMTIDKVETEKGQSNFTMSLETLNDKIFIFQQLFYKNKPKFETNFVDR